MSEILSSFGVTNGAEAVFPREIREVFRKLRSAAGDARDPADFDLCDMHHIMARALPGATNDERAKVRRRLAGPS
jgi:hypothetical protein